MALSADTLIRFLPTVANYNGTPPGLFVYALDDTYSGSFSAASLVTVDATTHGSATAISFGTTALNTTITPVNDAPVASGSATLAAINEDTTAPPGATISSLFSANFSDAADQVASLNGSSANTFAGIAISSYTADASKGAWQYSTDSGADWTPLANATDGTAITLNATDMLRFVPAANYNGAATTLSANVIESGQSITSGATVDLTVTGATGGTSHISSGTIALSETINAVNDAPVASGSATLGTIDEDTASPAGATVNSLFGGNFSDTADQVLAVPARIHSRASRSAATRRMHPKAPGNIRPTTARTGRRWPTRRTGLRSP